MKKDLTEDKLLELGFKKITVTPQESGYYKTFYYFVYDLFNGECLLTDDEIGDDDLFSVSFLGMSDAGKFWNSDDVKDIIKSIKKNKL